MSEVRYTDSVTGVTVNLYEILAGIWLIGIVVIFIHNVLADKRLRNRLSTSIPQKIIVNNKMVKIYRSDYISSGLAYGIVKPKVYISYTVNDNDIDLEDVYLYYFE